MTKQNVLNYHLSSGDDGKFMLADSNQDNGFKFALKSEYNKSTAPSINDDSTEGYEVGSAWINTSTGNIYECVDASAGAAVWKQLDSGGIGGSTGATDNAVLRADGSGGSTIKNSPVTIDNSGRINAAATLASANPAYSFLGDTDTGVSNPSANTIELVTSGNVALSVNPNGVIKKPLQPCFTAYISASANNVTGNGTTYTLAANTKLFDQSNSYNNSTFTFTAPVAGVYFFESTVRLQNVLGGNRAYIFITTTTRNYEGMDIDPFATKDTNNELGLCVTCLAYMNANDTATARIIVSGTSQQIRVLGHATIPYSRFSGYLVS